MTGAAIPDLELTSPVVATPSLEVRGAVVRLGKRDVELPDVAQTGAGIVLVDGQNGSGKTTTLEAIAARVPISRGEIRLQGLGAERAHRHRRFCGAEVDLLEDVPLVRQAALFARASSVTPGVAARALAAAGLGERLAEQPRRLSTGQRRLAWVVVSTLGSAPILLLDEPFAGLDGDAAEMVAGWIRRWAQSRLVVVVSHDGPDLQPKRRVTAGSRG